MQVEHENLAKPQRHSEEHDATRTQTVRLHFSQLDTLFGIELAKVASLRNETARRKYWGIHSFKK